MAGRPKDDDPVSSAEFLCLRLACGLTQKQAADYLGVSSQAVQSWETDTRTVPRTASDGLRALDAQIRGCAGQIPMASPVQLVRYRSEADYAGSPHAVSGLPMPAYNAMVLRVMDRLGRLGISYRVDWASH